MTAFDIDKLLKGAHGCISFSPTKGHRCDLMLRDESWITAYGKTIYQAVTGAVREAKKKGIPIQVKKR